MLPLLLIYDDSLHNRWTTAVTGGAQVHLDSLEDRGLLAGGSHVPCGRAISVTFNATTQQVALHTDDPVVASGASSSLVVSLAFSVPTGSASRCIGAGKRTGTVGRCDGHVACIGLRMRGTSDAQTTFVPLCSSVSFGADVDSVKSSTTAGLAASARRRRRLRNGLVDTLEVSRGGWQQVDVPFSTFVGSADRVNEILFVPGSHDTGKVTHLLLDEIWIASARPLSAGEKLASYGGVDMNPVLDGWLQGARQGGAASGARERSNGHFCEYMTSELGVSAGKRALCKMDGDHLDGRWMQTCDPWLIRRPDHFAYGRALPAVEGWYDYRICYRQSATERLRTLHALSWSWRPKSCALAPIRGELFDRWLGSRTLLLVGDSLMAQAYYSLLWLLGDAVTEHKDIEGVTPEDRKKHIPRNEIKMGQCTTSVGNEGGWLSVATLRGGGRIIKVLRHATIVDELYDLDRAWWARWVSVADIVVLNVGHHYHGVDAAFARYGQLARVGADNLGKKMKKDAQLVFRTTNIGHYACEAASRPLRSRFEAWKQLTTGHDSIWGWQPPSKGVDMFKDKYNWRGPPLFEYEWAAAASRAGTLGSRFTFLNVSFLDSRADGHVATSMRYSPVTGQYASVRFKNNFPLDCLHYCYPGPSDYWALSLSNLLLNNPRYS